MEYRNGSFWKTEMLDLPISLPIASTPQLLTESSILMAGAECAGGCGCMEYSLKTYWKGVPVVRISLMGYLDTPEARFPELRIFHYISTFLRMMWKSWHTATAMSVMMA